MKPLRVLLYGALSYAAGWALGYQAGWKKGWELFSAPISWQGYVTVSAIFATLAWLLLVIIVSDKEGTP